MQTYHLHCELVTACSLLETFEAFNDPANLAKITPSWLNFQIRTKNVAMRAGAEIEYTIHWFGLPMYWKTLITEYQPPDYFVDEQAKGPYALWRHRHTFEATPQGTKVVDHVEYALPLGVLGRLAHAVAVKRQLLAIFNFRQQVVSELLGAKTISSTPPVIGTN